MKTKLRVIIPSLINLDCWSIQLDSTKTISNLRSVTWPGYFAYHKSNSQIFGGVYIGHGIRNTDIPFMQ